MLGQSVRLASRAKNIRHQSTQTPPTTPKQKLNLHEHWKSRARTPWEKKLVRDMERGNLWEWHQISHTGAKPFKAEILAKEHVKPLPQELLEGTNLNHKDVNLKEEFKKQSSSIVITSQKRLLSHFMVDDWRNQIKRIAPDQKVYEIIFPQTLAYRMLNPVLKIQLNKKLDKEEKENVIFLNNSIDLDPNSLGIDIENSYLIYVFLVDSAGRTRWRAVGRPEQHEVEQLEKLIKGLEKLDPKKKS
eukprot:TRINITY_DN3574_c0_g1_i2.p2 TRINITY_DN3574_c0_g1~~TRINITY_DN3574_c0_g1_i2.p2  ORF type:complete len:245 (+),score=59.79 TRINITY_DN3574_c0_g1_i2:26-760(+)